MRQQVIDFELDQLNRIISEEYGVLGESGVDTTMMERPKITLGEDIALSDEDTEDELEKKATETVALNL